MEFTVDVKNKFAALTTDDSDEEMEVPKEVAHEHKPRGPKKAPAEPVMKPTVSDVPTTEEEPSDMVEDRSKKERGRRKGPDAPRQGKRQFDRHSGTGRDPVMKKSGRGAHNWGDASGDAEVVAKVDEEPIEDESAEKEEKEEEKKPEERTFEDFAKASAESSVRAQPVRRAGDGVSSKFGGRKVVRDEDPFMVLDEQKDAPKKESREKPRKANVIPITEFIGAERSERPRGRGRGDRGRGERGRGMRGERGRGMRGERGRGGRGRGMRGERGRGERVERGFEPIRKPFNEEFPVLGASK
eukprot:TRINITY_DN805_c0_g1_i2.p1 TRINITY_DN805_c0_g1~~TRINITY_DN805_c0_g1_i2.p1  ORF type:complete len:299 (-),score=114.67 TRINITY_DN805_c0_g1_i2:1658-2554(-)